MHLIIFYKNFGIVKSIPDFLIFITVTREYESYDNMLNKYRCETELLSEKSILLGVHSIVLL